MSNRYYKTFELKDEKQRKSVSLVLYTGYIRLAEQTYNIICTRTKNKKHIAVTIYSDHLDFEILSANSLKQKYLGITLRLFSQILVQQYAFLPFCTNANPRKLFRTVKEKRN